MTRCACGSYAINPYMHGRDPKEDLDLCDVCYWRKRATSHPASRKLWFLVEAGGGLKLEWRPELKTYVAIGFRTLDEASKYNGRLPDDKRAFGICEREVRA